MKTLSGIHPPKQTLNIPKGILSGEGVISSVTTAGKLKNYFQAEDIRKALPQDQEVYRVQAHLPVPEGTEGGLFFGTTWIKPGQVGDEYFMTRGHFHAKSDRSEYYWGLSGEGMLILMDRNRHCWCEVMQPGSLHYIPPHTAHRVANTGQEELAFGACWPADAGHDYEEIIQKGFSCALINHHGKPKLIAV